LNLAFDRAGVSHQADELRKIIQALEKAIAAKADNDSLIKLAAETKEGFAKLATANNAVTSSLSATLKVTEAPDVVVSSSTLRRNVDLFDLLT
jgi:hypothetical protein